MLRCRRCQTATPLRSTFSTANSCFVTWPRVTPWSTATLRCCRQYGEENSRRRFQLRLFGKCGHSRPCFVGTDSRIRRNFSDLCSTRLERDSSRLRLDQSCLRRTARDARMVLTTRRERRERREKERGMRHLHRHSGAMIRERTTALFRMCLKVSCEARSRASIAERHQSRTMRFLIFPFRFRPVSANPRSLAVTLARRMRWHVTTHPGDGRRETRLRRSRREIPACSVTLATGSDLGLGRRSLLSNALVRLLRRKNSRATTDTAASTARRTRTAPSASEYFRFLRSFACTSSAFDTILTSPQRFRTKWPSHCGTLTWRHL
eukprot:Opistho-2@34865